MKPSFRSALAVLWDSFLPNNVVLVQALGFCPILSAGIHLRYGVALSVCTIVTMVLTNTVFSLFSRFISKRLQPPLYVLLSSAFLLGAMLVLHQFVSAEIYAHLYLFLPLLAVNTLYTYRATVSPTAKFSSVLVTAADALGTSLGFSLVLCIASALREITINGTLWDLPLGFSARFPEAAHPFIGFILLGFMVAALRWFKQLGNRKEEEVGLS